MQLTLPEIQGIHLRGPGEVKVKQWPEYKTEGFPPNNAVVCPLIRTLQRLH
jgi:hypothetical protein